MSYFNHSFNKAILATGGICDTADKMLWDLNAEAAGGNPKVAFIGVKGSVKDAILTKTTKNEGEQNEETSWDEQPFMIAGSTVRGKDKLGKFAAAYQAPNTSKIVNPKYVSKLYVVFPQTATNSSVSVGNVDLDGGDTPCSPGFKCGTTYYLQLDIKGSKVASVLMHNYHQRIPAFVSCCGSEDPTADLTDNGAAVYLEWAKYINNDPIAQNFVKAYVVAGDDIYGEAIEGDAKVGTVAGSIADFEALLATAIGTGAGEREEITSAGLYILAAYEDTKVGDCSFSKRDGNNLVPIEVFAQHVDVDGNPCFTHCPISQTVGLQATRTRKSLLDEVILDESYRQNFMSDCVKKRDIEGSNELFSYLPENEAHPGVYIEHNVPRNINPSGTFDNDRYLIHIITTGSQSSGTLSGNVKDIVEALEGLTGIDAEIYEV